MHILFDIYHPEPYLETMKSALDQLKSFTTVVADTSDINIVKQIRPRDVTTNPSLILKAAKLPEYSSIIEEGREIVKKNGISDAVDSVFTSFGAQILSIIDGRISTEVDARLSFDVAGTVNRAKKLIADYENLGFSRERVLIKIAATWEGIEAAKILEKQGVHCNLTLLFSKVQAVACADAEVTLISPFVGRILDWYRTKFPEKNFDGQDDPGVKSVREIFNYYKHFGYQTEIMGASFRNIEEVLALAGCDLLTINPTLLDQLSMSYNSVERQLSTSDAMASKIERLSFDEKSFRLALNADAMASEKLSEGIRLFIADIEKIENVLMG